MRRVSLQLHIPLDRTDMHICFSASVATIIRVNFLADLTDAGDILCKSLSTNAPRPVPVCLRQMSHLSLFCAHPFVSPLS